MPAGLSQITQSNCLAQLAHDAGHALTRERVLVAGLRGGEQVQRVDALVADQGLRQLGVALGDVDEVVDDPALGPHHQVEVAQADIEIDHHAPSRRLAPARRRAQRSMSSCRPRPCRMSPPVLSPSPFPFAEISGLSDDPACATIRPGAVIATHP